MAHVVRSVCAPYAGAGLLLALAALTTAVTLVQPVQAAEPTPERLQLLRERCNVIKTRLDVIIKNEAADRIRRGRAYDQNLLPYISAFNSRVAGNNVDAPELIRIAAELQELVGRSQFGSQFSIYSDDLNGAVHSDCKANPELLHDWLDKARIDRATLAETIRRSDALISEYIAELEKLEQRYTPVINLPEPTGEGQ